MLAQDEARKLTQVDLDEISGVTEAANLFKGWLMLKSKGGDASVTQSANEIAELLSKAEEYHTSLNKLAAALSETEDYFEAAPGPVKEATSQLSGYVKHVLSGEEPEKEEQKKDREKTGFIARALANFWGVGESKKKEQDEAIWKELCDAIASGPTKGGQ